MKIRVVMLVFAVFLQTVSLVACNLPTRQSSEAETSTPSTDLIPTMVPTPVSICDNKYFPNHEGTTWEYVGNNSAVGNYARKDVISSATEDSFTMQSTVANVTYSVGYSCSSDGLTSQDPVQQYLGALLGNPNTPVSVTLNSITGITLPVIIMPGDTWQQTASWNATGAGVSMNGKLVFDYTAVGNESISVLSGAYNALRINATVSIKVSALQIPYGSYSVSFWLVPDIGIIKSEGTSQITGVDFSDSYQLAGYSPAP